MRLVDISIPIDPDVWEPDPVEMSTLSPVDGGKHMVQALRNSFGVEFDIGEFPGGEFLSLDTLRLTTHTGTHVDAPSHYGTPTDGTRPSTIDELPLEWFQGSGVVLDLVDVDGWVITKQDLTAAEKQSPIDIGPKTIVLLRTGAWRFWGTPEYFTRFVGLSSDAINYLLDKGVRVVGTDAFSLDSPFTRIIEEYRKGGDESLLWPAHVVGRSRPYCQIERLGDLSVLVGKQFTVFCFPVAVKGAGAGWARAVAAINEESDSGQ